MINRTFLTLLCLVASIGLAWAQDTTSTAQPTPSGSKPAAVQSQETVTISKSEFEALKDSVAEMRKELDQLKGKQAQPSAEPAAQSASSPQAAPAVDGPKSDTSDDSSFESDDDSVPGNAAATQPVPGYSQQPSSDDKSATVKAPAYPEEQPSEGEAYSSDTAEQEQTSTPQAAAAPSIGGGKALALPDISLIGQAKGVASTDKQDGSRNTLRLSELELGIQGYVYPNVKADAFITASPQEDAPFAVEEAYLSYLSALKGLTLYVGEKHVPFGRTNLVHSHSWLYANQPKALRNLVAEESLGGEGIGASYLIPTNSDLFAQIDLGTWTSQGQEAGEPANLPDIVAGSGAGFSNHFNTARLWTSYPIAEDSELELGGSYAKGAAFGQGVPGYGQATLTGMDLSYRHFGEGNKRLLLRAENIWRKEDAEGLKNTVSGYYLFGNYRWDKDHSLGLLYDWSQFPQLEALGQHESALSLIYTRQFSEQYYIRLQATHGSRPDDHSYNELWLQWVWGVGPHTHNLE